ncbi:MAG TPA: CehA/McbA family metallohydrolase [Kofleriaceae bacterium]|nr:CehA/McbA family metallohydrolase [Kofleriaceae bacterium]
MTRRLAALLVAAGCGQQLGQDAAPRDPPARAARAAPAAPAAPPDAAPAPLPWLRGSTHVHTAANSGDCSTPLPDVARWYADRGYDFIVVTDHNAVSELPAEPPLLLLRGIELTHNPGACEPAPPEPDGKCRIHVNGLGLAAATGPVTWKNQTSAARVDLYQAAIDKVRELGGVVQINHPTWHWGVDGDLLAELGRRGATLVEIANAGFATWNAGTAVHPSAEAVWDAALSRGVMVWGVASDDAHDYGDDAPARQAAGERVYPPGGGWVMVHAERTAEAIRAALARGDFYASSGVVLARAEVAGGALEVAVAEASPGAHDIVFIGAGGAVLERTHARTARFELGRAPAGYVRAVVEREDGKRAWVQPVAVP